MTAAVPASSATRPMHQTVSPRVAAALMPAAMALAAWLPAAPAHSHGIESSLDRLPSLSASLGDPDQATLLLQSRFGNGEPAVEATVRLVAPAGGAVEIGRTDQAGQLRFTLPPGARSTWELQVDAGPGHRDYLELPVSPGTSAGRGTAAAHSLASLAPQTRWLGLGVGLCAAGLLVRGRRRP